MSLYMGLLDSLGDYDGSLRRCSVYRKPPKLISFIYSKTRKLPRHPQTSKPPKLQETIGDRGDQEFMCYSRETGYDYATGYASRSTFTIRQNWIIAFCSLFSSGLYWLSVSIFCGFVDPVAAGEFVLNCTLTK
jgi:hypothetical protein